MESLKYKLIRSKRRTIGLEIRPEGVIVRAPMQATQADIDGFIREHLDWIEKHLKKAEELKAKTDALPKLTMDEIRELADKAMKVIPERVRHYAPLVGVTYGRITIRNQRSKWGSCTGKGNLNFNCLLMLAPPEVLDGVVVHELCHRKHMNHSKAFYAEVQRVYPDYKKWDKWLNENGTLLMSRMI
ncbi:MAG: M48 family metallopeptidase [Eubacterium sp.]|nr:M48 family metallopeptidase [Eubacterium sp.]